MVAATLGGRWQTERKIEENLQDGETNAGSGRKNGGRQRWEWENLRRSREQRGASNSASNDCTSWNRGGNFSIGTGHGSQDVNRDVRDCNNVSSASRRTRVQDPPSPDVFM